MEDLHTFREVARAIESLGLKVIGLDMQTGVLTVKIPTVTGMRQGSLNEE